MDRMNHEMDQMVVVEEIKMRGFKRITNRDESGVEEEPKDEDMDDEMDEDEEDELDFDEEDEDDFEDEDDEDEDE